MREEIVSRRGYAHNIRGDELSLKIASYPITAHYLAERLQGTGSTVCELCCGIGISLIELSQSFDKVIGVDSDESIIRDCRHNLQNAGITSFELLTADIASPKTLQNISADVVLYDIPYWSSHNGKVDPNKQNPDLRQLVQNIREVITQNIIIYAPTHMSYEGFYDELGECEYVQVYIDGKYDRNFVFLGSIMHTSGKVSIELSGQ